MQNVNRAIKGGWCKEMRGTSDSLHKGRGPSPTPDQLPELCAGPPASRVPPVPTAQPSLAPNPERGGVQSRGQGSAIYLELRGQEEAANRSRQGRARPGGVKRLRGPGPRGDGEAVAAGGGGGTGPAATLGRPRAAAPTHAAAAPRPACTCSSHRSRPRRGRRIWGSPSASPSSSSRTRARSAPRTAPACR